MTTPSKEAVEAAQRAFDGLYTNRGILESGHYGLNVHNLAIALDAFANAARGVSVDSDEFRESARRLNAAAARSKACPICNGSKAIEVNFNGDGPVYDTCPTCNGTGSAAAGEGGAG